jgi:hypothetical protein
MRFRFGCVLCRFRLAAVNERPCSPLGPKRNLGSRTVAVTPFRVVPPARNLARLCRFRGQFPMIAGANFGSEATPSVGVDPSRRGDVFRLPAERRRVLPEQRMDRMDQTAMTWIEIKDLVEKAQTGDRIAYGELVERFQPTVYAVA